ncbi:ABC transporter permease [Negadavirga shengliensis]
MKIIRQAKQTLSELVRDKRTLKWSPLRTSQWNTHHPFWVIVHKEISDHVRSWRLTILAAIIIIACAGSLIAGLMNFREAVKSADSDDAFFFLNLFTASGSGLPSFVVFVSFLGPLLGIGLGFDAINSEQNRGTLGRIMAQPIYRDHWINAKFTAALLVVSILFFALGFLVLGLGLIKIGIAPTVEEFLRIMLFILVSIFYVAFWLNLSIFFSVRFRQAATSALSCIAVWLFLTVFYGIIVNMIAKVAAPSEMATPQEIIRYQEFVINLLRILPSQLYSDATTTLLTPSIRSLSPLTSEQIYGTIPSPLPLGQSVMLVWGQLTGLISATVICFAMAYLSFMKKEIRSR